MSVNLSNKSDPLNKQDEASRELLLRVGELFNGVPYDKVIDVGANLIINAVRQQYPTRQGAERRAREVTEKLLSLLLDGHYNSNGSRKNVYAFTQRINVDEVLKSPPKILGI